MTVSAGSGTGRPNGQVEFFAGLTSLGKVTITNGATTSITYTLTGAIKLSPAGPYSITAVYTPANGNFLTSTSSSALTITTH